MSILFLLLSVFLASPGDAQCLSKDIIPNKFIVRLKNSNGLSLQSITANPELKTRTIFRGQKNLTGLGLKTGGSNEFPTTLAVEVKNTAALETLAADKRVETIEPDCRVQLAHELGAQQINIEDPMLNQQWALAKIEAQRAWTITPGSQEITVAISDTGVDYLHSDLTKNMWVNKKEVPNNGVDDDDNGCIDDIYGCNLAEQRGDPMPASGSMALSHGTHVAGIVGAVGNNGVGVSGVAQNVRLMAAKGFTNDLDGDESILLQSVYYSVNNGARIINCSWARMGAPLKAEIDAFNYAFKHGVVVVGAAGNSQLDAAGFSPSSLPHVISVGATDKNDNLARFSNWGKIDLLAPGGKGFDSSGVMLDPILSTLPRSTGNYGNFIGTSMAAPFVSGLAALILSVNSKLTPTDVLKIMQLGADSVHVTNTYGTPFDNLRINAAKSVQIAKTFTPSEVGSYISPECNASESPCNLESNPSQNRRSESSSCGLALGTLKKNGADPPDGPSAYFIFLPLLVVVLMRYRILRFS